MALLLPRDTARVAEGTAMHWRSFVIERPSTGYPRLTACILDSPAEVAHRGSLGEYGQKHVERSRVHCNLWLHSCQQLRGPLASLVYHRIGSITYRYRDDVFLVQLPRQNFRVLYSLEQSCWVLSERLASRIASFSPTRSHSKLYEVAVVMDYHKGWLDRCR